MFYIDAKQFKKALISGAYALINKRSQIDALNVFPVPDGDTGSNMAGTIKSAISDIENESFKTIGELTKKFARGALLGARGNSGVILSQIFKGFAVGLNELEKAHNFNMVEAFKQAKIYAYNSVMKPVEGTLLTVIRVLFEDLKKNVTSKIDVIKFWTIAIKSVRKTCDLTPSLLPILKEVGVTDSGGEGFHLILEGILQYFKGHPVTLQANTIQNGSPDFLLGSSQDHEGEFGYCTEAVVELKKPKKFVENKFKHALEKLGDSIVVVRDQEILKVHLHTLAPGSFFTFAQKFGEFIKLKSENMTLQANVSQGQKLADISTNQIKNKKSGIAIITCNNGHGIINEMKNLGADVVIEGGQSNNPSTRDFLTALSKIKSKNIIILPNNSNIMLVAQQVVQTIRDKKIIIIPTKTQVEGLAAMINFDRENTLEENQELMLEGIETTNNGQVTIATKDTKISGKTIKKNQFLALANRKVIGSYKSKVQAATKIVDKLTSDDTEIITIWYGAGATQTDAQELADYIESKYNPVVEVKKGGQNIYDFLISFE